MRVQERALPAGSVSEEPACQCRRPRLDPQVRKIPKGAARLAPAAVSRLEDPMGKRSLWAPASMGLTEAAERRVREHREWLSAESRECSAATGSRLLQPPWGTRIIFRHNRLPAGRSSPGGSRKNSRSGEGGVGEQKAYLLLI